MCDYVTLFASGEFFAILCVSYDVLTQYTVSCTFRETQCETLKNSCIKERINIDTTESQTSYVFTRHFKRDQGSSHMVNERLTVCNAKKARRHKAASAIDETHT